MFSLGIKRNYETNENKENYRNKNIHLYYNNASNFIIIAFYLYIVNRRLNFTKCQFIKKSTV